MAGNRPKLSFPELEGRGRHAILRTADEVQAEEQLLAVQAAEAPAPQPKQPRRQTDTRLRPTPPSNRDTTVDTTTPWYHDTTVQTVAKAVRRPGKEAATLRLSAEEKTRLADLVYTYRRRGQRTSETELIRIAIHAAMEDYDANGERSLLAQVMATLEP